MRDRGEQDRISTRWRFWAILAAMWTLPWAVMGVQDVLNASIIAQAGLSSGLTAHAIFNLVFVAAYAGVRWMLGMAVLAGVALVVEWPLHRKRASA